eukprot:768593-Hanusia_phi.AAC.5
MEERGMISHHRVGSTVRPALMFVCDASPSRQADRLPSEMIVESSSVPQLETVSRPRGRAS